MGLLRASVELYEQLEAETGHAVDYHRCGSVRIATGDDRVHQFLHVGGIAASVGVPFEIVTPDRALELSRSWIPRTSSLPRICRPTAMSTPAG